MLLLVTTLLFFGAFIGNIREQKLNNKKVVATPSKVTTSIQPTDTVTSRPTLFVEDKYGLEPPTLYNELNWSVVPKEKQILNEIHWSSEKHSGLGAIKLSGVERLATQRISAKDQIEQMEGKLRGYYDNELDKRNWKGPVDIFRDQKYIFSLASAAGPLGMNMGYAKIVENKLRVIYIQTAMPSANFVSPGKIVYPFTKTYRVFISDIIPLSDLSKQIKE